MNVSACDCDPKGTTDEVCDKRNGQCLCKEGFGGPRCDRCEPGVNVIKLFSFVADDDEAK